MAQNTKPDKIVDYTKLNLTMGEKDYVELRPVASERTTYGFYQVMYISGYPWHKLRVYTLIEAFGEPQLVATGTGYEGHSEFTLTVPALKGHRYFVQFFNGASKENMSCVWCPLS